jgi:Cu/Ag efflux protein CusF
MISGKSATLVDAHEIDIAPSALRQTAAFARYYKLGSRNQEQGRGLVAERAFCRASARARLQTVCIECERPVSVARSGVEFGVRIGICGDGNERQKPPHWNMRRGPMKAATILFAGVAAATISLSAYAADQGTTGMVTGINRLNGTIAIQRIQTGTVGANTGGTGEEFKVKDAAMMEDVHAGDRVTFSATDSGGAKTITKIDRQK